MLNPFMFEAAMLVCFGAAWPVSIYKSYKSKSNRGKSVYFLYILLIGYINGIVFQWLEAPNVHYILILFLINTVMISIDIGLFYRNMC